MLETRAETEGFANPIQQIDGFSKPRHRARWECNEALRLVKRNDLQ